MAINFDPNAASESDGIFGLPFSENESELVILPVPFEATTSYGSGTAEGPSNILMASQQVDLYHPVSPSAWKRGIFMRSISSKIKAWNKEGKNFAEKARDDKKFASEVNQISNQLNEWVATQAKEIIDAGKILATLGGDHAVPYSSIRLHLEKYPKMGLLHIDAHHDLRKAYEGFEHSHASIFYNIIEDTKLQKLVQVGIRDYCDEEKNYALAREEQIIVFYDDEIFNQKANGVPWKSFCREIVGSLPFEVYVSFDVDGLDPSYCPGTGTPVPGGLSFQEAIFLLREILRSGRKIIGFDLCEVGAQEFDGNVGARLLYELSVLALHSKT